MICSSPTRSKKLKKCPIVGTTSFKKVKCSEELLKMIFVGWRGAAANLLSLLIALFFVG